MVSFFLILGLISINLSSSAGEFQNRQLLENIAGDYCEAYCKGSCNDETNQRCDNEDKNFILTNEYTLNLRGGELEIKWNNPDSRGCDITPITRQKYAKLKVIIVTQTHRDCLGVDYLRQLGVESVYRFELHLSLFKAVEKRVHNVYGPQSLAVYFQDTVNFNEVHDYVKESMSNLQEIIISAKYASLSQAVAIDENIFKWQPDLETISFEGFNIENITTETFAPLINLKKLVFSGTSINNLSLVSFNSLRSSLQHLVLDIPQQVNLQHFKTFPQLKLINVRNYIPCENLTAMICTRSKCKFNRGINGVVCPDICVCRYNYNYMELQINCSNRGLTQIPPLPIPHIGDSKLIFQNNSLSQLPNYTSVGYYSLRKLDVARNQLTKLSLSHLPRKLDYLDITFNKVNEMDSDIVEYVRNVRIFKQAGNQWQVYCDDDPILHLFRSLRNIIRMKAKRMRPIFRKLLPHSPEGFIKFLSRHLLRQEREYFVINEDQLVRSMLLTIDDLGKQIYIRQCMEWLHRNLSYYNEEYETLKLYKMETVCPYKCECCQYRTQPSVRVDCQHKFLFNFPDVISGKELLAPDANNTEYLELHLANNNITKITIEMLPKNLSYLDLRNNNLETLDNRVIQFLQSVRFSAEIKLSGNPWKCNCGSRPLLSFLRDQDPKEYTATLKRCNISRDDCPDSCVCCLDNSIWPSFVVDCVGEGLQEVPQISGNVSYMDLRNNNISELVPTDVLFFSNRSQDPPLKLFMAGNPWSCTCRDVEYLTALKSISSSIADFTEMTCTSGEKVLLIEKDDICPSGLPYYLALAATLAAVLVAINFLVCFRQPLLIWLYEHDLFLSLAARMELDQGKKFDAFLAFTHKDEELVEEFVERLEKGSPPFRLCFYLRDWLAGECIPDCINRSVRDSRRIIILMTTNFLKSTWGRLEFRLALHATSQDRCKRLIVVLYPDVKGFDELDSELRAYMVFNTYLERSHPNFWNKLVYSMPHVKRESN